MIVTDESFDSVIKDNDLILIDFWAPWCGPCQKMSPILDDISNEHGLLIGKINIDENTVEADKFSITSIPTLVLFKGGIPIHTITGAKPKHLLVKEISEWI